MTFCSLTDQTLYQSMTILPNSTFYWIMRGFHRTFATGVTCRQGTLTPPDTWFRPFCEDLHVFYLLRPILFLGLLFFRTMLFERPFVLFPRATRCGGDIVTLPWFRPCVCACVSVSVKLWSCEHDRYKTIVCLFLKLCRHLYYVKYKRTDALFLWQE